MKTILYKLIVLVFLLPGFMFGGNDFTGKHTKEKKVSKTFEVAADANLKIDNSYGYIDIATWDKNAVSIEVFIKTNGNDADKVQEKLDNINIQFKQTSTGVSVKTHFGKDKRSFWDAIFSSFDNVNMEVNYIVRAPASNNLDISNDYGAIIIDKVLGNTKISCDYGRMEIDELQGDSNYLNFDYTRDSRIGYIKNAEINADYSDFVVEEARKLYVNADYTDSRIIKVTELKYTCDYGKMEIGKVKRLEGNGDYLNTRIERLYGRATINVDYGGVTIEKLMESLKSLDISSDYAGIKIGYDQDLKFNFDIQTSYASVKGLDNFELKKSSESSNSRNYSGYYNSGKTNTNITINSSYGNISFK